MIGPPPGRRGHARRVRAGRMPQHDHSARRAARRGRAVFHLACCAPGRVTCARLTVDVQSCGSDLRRRHLCSIRRRLSFDFPFCVFLVSGAVPHAGTKKREVETQSGPSNPARALGAPEGAGFSRSREIWRLAWSTAPLVARRAAPGAPGTAGASGGRPAGAPAAAGSLMLLRAAWLRTPAQNNRTTGLRYVTPVD